MTVARQAGLSQEELRRRNLGSLLTRVHLDGPTTRASLTSSLGLNRSTIGDLTGQLEQLGLVEERLPAVARRSGRPSLEVVPRTDVGVVAVDIGVDRITVAVVLLGGEVAGRRERVHQRGSHAVEHVVEAVAQMVSDLRRELPGVRCLSVGAAVPGAVRREDGVVRFAPNLGWVDAPFSGLLSRSLGIPVLSGNDGDLGVLAEHLRGAARGFDDVAYLTGSVGIGGGFVVGGVPLRGSSGYAGEIGHVVIDPGGEKCRCGGVGCWEMKIGEDRLLREAGRLSGGGAPAVAEVVEAAQAGDPAAAEAVAEVARWVGLGLRGVVNTFDPDVVVLAGTLAQLWQAAEAGVRAALEDATPVGHPDRLLVRPAALGADSALLGAAELCFAELLADPGALASA